MGDLSFEHRAALIARLTALADDELLLSQRLAGWTGHAPILEEDIALANIAQDELGHAIAWLELRRTLDGSDPDRLAYWRGPADFRNSALTELPKGDWAFSMLRQYLYDGWEALWQDAAKVSAYVPLAQAAALALREERFHLQHTALWVERLALGTPESERRIKAALAELWPYALGLFEPLDLARRTPSTAGLLPDPAALRAALAGTGRRLRLARFGLTARRTPSRCRAASTPNTWPRCWTSFSGWRGSIRKAAAW